MAIVCSKVCYKCLGEKGFLIDKKDPRNPDYAFDMCEDYFETCGACDGIGTIDLSYHQWMDYEDQCDNTVKCIRCGVLGEVDESAEGGVFYPVT